MGVISAGKLHVPFQASLYEASRRETIEALETLIKARRNAFVLLKKPADIMGLLSLKQRDLINRGAVSGQYTLEQISRNIAGGFSAAVPAAALLIAGGVSAPAELTSHPSPKQTAAFRKNMLRFGVIHLRAQEMTAATNKAAAALEYQYRQSLRRLFPLGFLSRFWRKLKTLFGTSYFSWKDLVPVRALLTSAGFVLKIAEAPVF